MIKIYGSPASSAGRCYWTLHEIGLEYERIPLDMRKGEHKTPEFQTLNPNGKVPCLTEGNLVLWESMAIDNYLAEKYKPELLGSSPEEKGLVLQWSYWAILEPQKHLVDIFIQNVFTPEEKRDQNIITTATEALQPLFSIFDKFIQNKEYVLGERFTLADLHVASVFRIAKLMKLDLADYENLNPWLENILSRDSHEKVIQLGH